MSKLVRITKDLDEVCKFDKNNKLRCRWVEKYRVLDQQGNVNVWNNSLKEAKQFCAENKYTIVERFPSE